MKKIARFFFVVNLIYMFFTAAVYAKEPVKTDGIALAVVQPQLRNVGKSDAWISSFLQDTLTGSLAKFSKITVVDKINEDSAKAEIKMTESNYYDDETAIEIGQMTNARYVVFGTVQKLSSSYELNFRINNIETNEIIVAFNNRYSLSEIETGKAINDIVIYFFDELKIELSDKEKQILSTMKASESKSRVNFAKGITAENSGDIIEALDYYANVTGENRKEAQQKAYRLLDGTIPTGSIKEKAEFYKKQQEKWKIVFRELEPYLERELPIFVYDFSLMNDSINSDMKSARIEIEPGVKLVPRRSAVYVWKQIMDTWESVKANKENASWTAGLTSTAMKFYNWKYPFNIGTGLYNYDGSKIEAPGQGNVQRTLVLKYDANFNVKSQKKYFDDAPFGKVSFRMIKIDEIEGELFPIVDSIEKDYGGGGSPNKAIKNPCIMSMEEWQEFVDSL